MKFVLNPHQERAIDLLRQSLATGHKRPMLQAPTGAGKTVVGASIVEGALRKGNPVLFVVPFLSLVDQTVERFMALSAGVCGLLRSIRRRSVDMLANHPMDGARLPLKPNLTIAFPSASVRPYQAFFATIGQDSIPEIL